MRRKQYFQKPAATLWTILIVCLSGILIINACRKADKIEKPPIVADTNNMKERFFNEHKATDPLVQAVTGYFHRLPDTQFVVNKIVARIGYPRWDKALVYAVSKTAGKGNEAGDSVNVSFIPFVRDSQQVVNAVLQVTTTPSDTLFRYICDWQYTDSVTTGNNGREQSLLLMLLDKNVFGERWYKIKDSLAYGSDPGYQTRFVKIESSSVSVNQRPFLNRGANYYAWVYITVCTEEWVQGEWVYGCEPNDPNCNGGSYQTVCYQNAYWAYVDDGGGGSGGGGEGGSGEGSGGGGGGSNGGTPPDCNGPGGGINPNRTANVNPCEPGWEPIPIEDVYNPNAGVALFQYFNVNAIDQSKIDIWKSNNIDTMGLDSCRRALLRKLMNVLPSNPLGALLSKLDNAVGLPTSIDKFTIHFITRPLSNYEALTEHTTYNEITNEFEADIVLDSAMSKNATELFVANTLLHEIVHAYMAYIWRKFNQGASPSVISSLTEGTIFNAYVDTLMKRDSLNPNMLQWFSEKFQHNYMADQLLEFMSNIIKVFDNNSTTPERYYWYLAWSGLTRKSVKTWNYFWPNYPSWPPTNPAPSNDSTRGLKYALTLQRIDTIHNQVLDDERFSKPNAKGRKPLSGGCY